MAISNFTLKSLGALSLTALIGCRGRGSSSTEPPLIFVPAGKAVVGVDCFQDGNKYNPDFHIEPGCDKSLDRRRRTVDVDAFYVDRQPAGVLTYESASALCLDRGLRLLTSNEFDRIVRGPQGDVEPRGAQAHSLAEKDVWVEGHIIRGGSLVLAFRGEMIPAGSPKIAQTYCARSAGSEKP